MPLNQIKKYPELLELSHYSEQQRRESLLGIFNRDIGNDSLFNFRKKQIRPTKEEGEVPMQTLYHHLTTRNDYDENGKKLNARTFEMARSQRLHWVKVRINELQNEGVDVFSYEDRVKGKDVVRTYIYDTKEKYVIILEPQKSKRDYFLLTAYYLNEPGGEKQIKKKRKKKLSEVY